MDTDKIDFVAREMFEKRTKNRAKIKWHETHSHTRATWREIARIALAAIATFEAREGDAP